MQRKDIPDQEIIDCYRNYWANMPQDKDWRVRNYDAAVACLPWNALPYPEKLVKSKAYRMAQQGKLGWLTMHIYTVPDNE